jgi:hypothetical protein
MVIFAGREPIERLSVIEGIPELVKEIFFSMPCRPSSGKDRQAGHPAFSIKGEGPPALPVAKNPGKPPGGPFFVGSFVAAIATRPRPAAAPNSAVVASSKHLRRPEERRSSAATAKGLRPGVRGASAAIAAVVIAIASTAIAAREVATATVIAVVAAMEVAPVAFATRIASTAAAAVVVAVAITVSETTVNMSTLGSRGSPGRRTAAVTSCGPVIGQRPPAKGSSPFLPKSLLAFGSTLRDLIFATRTVVKASLVNVLGDCDNCSSRRCSTPDQGRR